MREVAQKHIERLAEIKETVRNSYDYFQHNYDRFIDFRKFVFESSMTDAEIALLQSLNRPQLEFNVLEAYVSRLLGEFSKQEPDIEVTAYDDADADPLTIELVEKHLKHVFEDDDNQHLRYEVYKDLLSGGFSVVKVYTKYTHAMSMSQMICFEKCEPTLCGFDPSARLAHKGDGQYCFEIFPKSKEDFEKEYPDFDTAQLSFRRDFEGFNWSYINNNKKSLLLCDFYEKRIKEETIVQVAERGVMTMKAYKDMIQTWDDFTLPPQIIGKPRKTFLEKIVRYRIIENTVLEYEDTDYEMLPIVFIDGHSMMISSSENTDIRQMTRPYVYHARGAQRLKNYAGNSLANEIESTVQHKFMVAKEALPKEEKLLEAYKNPQQASVLVYNAFSEENPDMPIQNPLREVMRVPPPQEIAMTFSSSDSTIQNILGSYDAALGINNNQLSGIAIVEAATQSNSAAMPYIVGCLQGMQRLAQIYVNLMPKYIVTPRSLPFVDDEGKKRFIKINQEGGVDIDFDPLVLNVSLKAGASFQVQKSRTINMIKELMGMSPDFAQFINSKGLRFVLDNLEGRGIDQLKESIEEWTQQQQQQQEQEMQMQQQQLINAPAQIRAETDKQRLDLDAQKAQQEAILDQQKLQLEKEKMLINAQLTQESFDIRRAKNMLDKDKQDSDSALKTIDMAKHHRHAENQLTHDILKNIATLNAKARSSL